MASKLGQDWMEYYQDEDWGTPDYPYSMPIASPSAVQEEVTDRAVVSASKPESAETPVLFTTPIKASILDGIPTWGWIAMGIAALFFFSKGRK